MDDRQLVKKFYFVDSPKSAQLASEIRKYIEYNQKTPVPLAVRYAGQFAVHFYMKGEESHSTIVPIDSPLGETIEETANFIPRQYNIGLQHYPGLPEEVVARITQGALLIGNQSLSALLTIPRDENYTPYIEASDTGKQGLI